ncbi:PQQ-dependent sugar dehydrogenase OS=Streptomyces tendae OX=1932 GN=GUR47_36570 PE=4 SV=1 [Streptomyces tendae]
MRRPLSSSASNAFVARRVRAAPLATGLRDVHPDQVATGLDSPWGLAPLPGGDLLVSSRDEATITRVDEKTGEKTELGEVPGVSPSGEGGLLGIALSPDYASDHLVYAYFTSASDNRVVRMLYDEKKPAGEQLGAPDTVFRGIPKGVIHNGGRIAFGPDGMLYAGTGESGDGPVAGQGVPRRQDPADDPGRRTGARQPLSRLPRVLAGPPERAGPGLGRQAAAVRLGVRPGRLGRAERDRAGRRLRLARGGGQGRGLRVPRPPRPVDADEASPSGIAYAEGSVWMAGLRGERLWRIPLKGTAAAADPQAFLEGEYGPTAHGGSGGRRQAVAGDQQQDGRGDAKGDDDRILELRVT